MNSIDNKWIIITGTSLFPDHKRQWIECPNCHGAYHIWQKNKRKCNKCGTKIYGTVVEEDFEARIMNENKYTYRY